MPLTFYGFKNNCASAARRRVKPASDLPPALSHRRN